MFIIIAGLSQFERDSISERTKEGLKSARARGRKGGRPAVKQESVEYFSSSTIGIPVTYIYRYAQVHQDSHLGGVRYYKALDLNQMLRNKSAHALQAISSTHASFIFATYCSLFVTQIYSFMSYHLLAVEDFSATKFYPKQVLQQCHPQDSQLWILPND